MIFLYIPFIRIAVSSSTFILLVFFEINSSKLQPISVPNTQTIGLKSTFSNESFLYLGANLSKIIILPSCFKTLVISYKHLFASGTTERIRLATT